MPKSKSEAAASLPPFADVRMELMTSRDAQAYLKKSDLVVLPVESAHEAIRLRPRPLAVLKGGRKCDVPGAK